MKISKIILTAVLVFTAMMFWGCEKQILPTPGYWEGETNEGEPVSFIVNSNQTYISDGIIKMTESGAGHGWMIVLWTAEIDDEGHFFYYSSIPFTASLEGDVVTSDSVDGSWRGGYDSPAPGSGTWWAVWKSEEAP
jgi:hypothetical protein